MEILKELNGNQLLIKVVGELNSFTAPELEKVIKDYLDDIKNLDFDFKELDYLSSAGLRVLLVAQKIMSKQGKMTLHNVNDSVMDIFEITGFINILDIER